MIVFCYKTFNKHKKFQKFIIKTLITIVDQKLKNKLYVFRGLFRRHSNDLPIINPILDKFLKIQSD